MKLLLIEILVAYYSTKWYKGIHEIAADWENQRNHGLLNIAQNGLTKKSFDSISC